MSTDTETQIQEKEDAKAIGRVFILISSGAKWAKSNIWIAVIGAYALGGGSSTTLLAMLGKSKAENVADSSRIVADSALRLMEKTYSKVETIAKIQAVDHVALKEVRGSVDELPGGKEAVKRYKKKEKAARDFLSEYPSPAEGMNYVSRRQQQRSAQ